MRILSQKTITRYTVSYREDGILHMHVSGGKGWNPEDYKILFPAIGEMVDFKKVPLLITFEKFIFPGSSEITYWANEETACPYFKADGFILDSLPLKVLGNFFLKFHKPARPTKLFEKKEEAITWLRTFL